MLQVPPGYMLDMLDMLHSTYNQQASLTPPFRGWEAATAPASLGWESKRRVCDFVCRQTHVLVVCLVLYCTVPYRTVPSKRYSTSGLLHPLTRSSLGNSSIMAECMYVRGVRLQNSAAQEPDWCSILGLLVYVPAAACYSGRTRRASSISNNCIMPRDSRSWLCCSRHSPIVCAHFSSPLLC
ncbi:hypothetical protein GGI43DRAFT_2298 [Trichoderma evansii]